MKQSSWIDRRNGVQTRVFSNILTVSPDSAEDKACVFLLAERNGPLVHMSEYERELEKTQKEFLDVCRHADNMNERLLAAEFFGSKMLLCYARFGLVKRGLVERTLAEVYLKKYMVTASARGLAFMEMHKK